MLMRKMLSMLGGALAAGLILTQAPLALAQDPPLVPGQADGGYDPSKDPENQTREGNVQRSTGRIARSNRQNRPEAPTPEANMAAAQASATAAGLSCQVTEATLLGNTPEGPALYEAACATGPGYLITASTPPQTIDCIIVAAAAARQAAADPTAAPALTCKLAANQDTLGAMAGFAREAGIPCQVDAGKPIGEAAGKTVYEIGCVGVDGYRLQQNTAGAWEGTECLIVVSAGSSCEFTTPAEQYASVKTRLAGTDGAGCVVDGARYMGGNANGVFYEAKCSGAEGYILRVKDNATQQIYPCAVAQPIGGGCTLTPVAPAPAPAAEPAETPAGE